MIFIFYRVYGHGNKATLFGRGNQVFAEQYQVSSTIKLSPDHHHHRHRLRHRHRHHHHHHHHHQNHQASAMMY